MKPFVSAMELEPWNGLYALFFTHKCTVRAFAWADGIFLLSFRNLHPPPKVLEIGLGCNMKYGAGASARLWRKLLPDARLFEAEFNEKCLALHHNALVGMGITPLGGDQNKASDLARWAAASNHAFDVIIDDGSHKNRAIMGAFERLWPTIAPGGLYFIEDLHVGRTKDWDDTIGKAVMADIINSWTEQLMVATRGWNNQVKKTTTTDATKEMRKRFPLPRGVKFITCSFGICVIAKQSAGVHTVGHWKPGMGCAQKVRQDNLTATTAGTRETA